MVNTKTNNRTPKNKIPLKYWVWLGGVAITMTCTQALAFGLVWVAAGISAGLAAAIAIAVIAPRVGLSLFGGAIADKVGPGRMMITVDALMVAVVGSLAFMVWSNGPTPILLIACSLALGVADGFYLPASGAIPKFMVPNDSLPQAMAGRQLVAQGTTLSGPALGGFVILFGLEQSLAIGAAGFFAMLLVLLGIRQALPLKASSGETSTSLIHGIKQSFITTWCNVNLRLTSLLTVSFSLFVLPLTSLLIPLIGQMREWAPTETGMVMGAFGGGMVLVSAIVLVKGGMKNAGLVASLGILIAGLASIGLSSAAQIEYAIAAAAIAGVGAAVFSTHLGPLFVQSAPREQIASLQSILILAQSIPTLVATPAIGALASTTSSTMTVMCWGLGAVLAGGTATGIILRYKNALIKGPENS